MPSIEQNRAKWDRTYRWERDGDEWSGPWGGAPAQWYGTLLPRIHRFLPAPTILEIAPGHGRWTEFLKDQCQQLHLVDLSEGCIRRCRERFAAERHLEYHVNDGMSLEMIPDNSIHLAFSFDSLVHAGEDVLEAYVRQLAVKLVPGGIAFIHHSNLGVYGGRVRLSRVPVLREVLRRLRLLDHLHWRDPAMTAEKMRRFAAGCNLRCIAQELVNWRTRRILLDCFTLLARANDPGATASQVMQNPRFMQEARRVRLLANLYRRPDV